MSILFMKKLIYKKYNLFLTGIYINVLRMGHGIAGLAFSS